MEYRREVWLSILHIFTLFNFAVAQPLFDLLSRNAEFFIVRHSHPLDIILLIGLLCIGLPLTIVLGEVVIGWLSHRVRIWVHGCVITVLAAAIALQALKRLGDLPGAPLIIGAGILGLCAAFSYKRFYPVRLFLTVLSPALIILPGLFLFSSSIFKIVFTKNSAEVAAIQIDNPPPIVMVIFDEFPVTALMDERQEIDPIRYPNFAALTRNAIWFRNATAVDQNTIYAVPSILDGNYPHSSRLPTETDHPLNLFTILSKFYKLHAVETITQLCPDKLCRKERMTLSRRLHSLLLDLSIVYFHLLLPDNLRASLPPVTQKWADFTSNPVGGVNVSQKQLFLDVWRQALQKDRFQQFTDFVNAIEPSPQPSLFFLHILLPHSPYTYLPSGKTYTVDTTLIGLISDVKDQWGDDVRAVNHNYRRHLLQVGFVDTLLGKMLARLHDTNLFDSTLIIVTADHGVSFQTGDFRRAVTPMNFQDVLPVPLFIKTPYQKTGVINDYLVETVDIFPTILDILGVQPSWPMDGRSALDPSPQTWKQESSCFVDGKKHLVFQSAAFEARSITLKQKLSLFGSGGNLNNLSEVSFHHDLIGRQIRDLNIVRSKNVQIQLDNPHLFAKVDPQSNFVPAHITGHLHIEGAKDASNNLAITINGTIKAVTHPWAFPVKGVKGKWSALVDESSFQSGWNDVQVFVISEQEGKLMLEGPEERLSISLSRND